MKFIALPWTCADHGSHQIHFNVEHMLYVESNYENPAHTTLLLPNHDSNPISLSLDEMHRLLPHFRRLACENWQTNAIEDCLINPAKVLLVSSLARSQDHKASVPDRAIIHLPGAKLVAATSPEATVALLNGVLH